jgi:hypothetical protein
MDTIFHIVVVMAGIFQIFAILHNACCISEFGTIRICCEPQNVSSVILLNAVSVLVYDRASRILIFIKLLSLYEI